MTANLNKIKDLETEVYRELCEEWKQASTELKEQEAYVESLRKQLIEKSGGDRCEYGVKIFSVTSRRTNYKKIVDDLDVPQEIIEKYVGMPETAWRIVKY